MQIAHAMANLGYADHAAADETYFPALLRGEIHDELQPVDGAGKAGDENAVLRSRKNLFETPPDSALGRREAGPLHVGGIGKERQDTAHPVFGDRVQVEEL